MVQFCDECGSLMFPSIRDGKRVFSCKCGAIKPFIEEISHLYKLKVKIEHSDEEDLQNISEFTK
jgi:DNA-directed RNA polymerase subunit M/transcription elongation factor TFIIS